MQVKIILFLRFSKESEIDLPILIVSINVMPMIPAAHDMIISPPDTRYALSSAITSSPLQPFPLFYHTYKGYAFAYFNYPTLAEHGLKWFDNIREVPVPYGRKR